MIMNLILRTVISFVYRGKSLQFNIVVTIATKSKLPGLMCHVILHHLSRTPIISLLSYSIQHPLKEFASSRDNSPWGPISHKLIGFSLLAKQEPSGYYAPSLAEVGRCP